MNNKIGSIETVIIHNAIYERMRMKLSPFILKRLVVETEDHKVTQYYLFGIVPLFEAIETVTFKIKTNQ